jgi:hypothetical protein
MSEALFDPAPGPATGPVTASSSGGPGTIPAGIPAEISAGVDGLDADGALAEAVRLRRGVDAAQARLLRVAAHWADLHGVLPDDTRGGQAAGHRSRTVIGGTERLVPLAGPGAPAVAEFAPAELGAALGMSTHAASVLVGNALELRHRLPRLWARVMAGQLPAWRASKVAEHTTTLCAPAAGFVDAQLAPVAHRVGLGRVLALVEAARKRFDPAAAAAQERRAAQTRGVWLGERMLHGTRAIHIEADALDAAAFDHTIADLAQALARFGDTDPLDVRRAKSVGTLADPQTALDLLSGHRDQHDEPGTDAQPGPAADAGDADPVVDGEADHAGEPASGPARRAAGPVGTAGPGLRRRPRVDLYVHLHQDAVEAGAGIGRVEGLGAATLAKIREWVGRADVRVTGVLDLDSRAAVDGHEVPDPMRETVFLRNPCCPFPWCPNLSRVKDDDHIEEYLPEDEGGPPGQTSPANLAGLCRRHHRCKTHGGWTYAMPEPGLYLWRSPHGRRYLVDHTGTTNLDTS